MHPSIHSSIIYNCHHMEAAYMSIKYYSAIKKNEILPFAVTWIDLEGIMLSEIKKTNTV